jgi:hypothetical protein
MLKVESQAHSLVQAPKRRLRLPLLYTDEISGLLHIRSLFSLPCAIAFLVETCSSNGVS